MLLFPKPTKRIKAPKSPKRSRIKPGKSKFKAHGDNPFKTYHSKYPTTETDLWAEQQAERRRSNPTEAEAAMEAILSRAGIPYVREKVWANGDHPVTSDFWLPSHKITLEIDGAAHRKDVIFDRRRALWLARKYGVGTKRFWNSEVFSGVAEAWIAESLGVG